MPGFYSAGAEDDALVDDCVGFVQMAAFSGDDASRRVWDEVGQDESALRDRCRDLLDSDRGELEDYAERKRILVREMSASDTRRADVIDDVTGGSSCNTNYSGICLPLDEDVDCLPGDGDGPWFLEKTVLVQGIDEFELDDDGDGLGCEPNPGRASGI